MKSKLVRIDVKLEKIFRDSARKRVQNDVDKETRNLPEISGMIQNTPSFPKVIKELETIPKKEDMRR